MAKSSKGRSPSPVTGSFFNEEPNRAQIAIILKKNTGGVVSWQTLADELNGVGGTSYSSAYIYRIAKGEIKANAAIRRALGLEQPYPSYFKCRRDDPAQVARQIARYMPDYELVPKD